MHCQEFFARRLSLFLVLVFLPAQQLADEASPRPPEFPKLWMKAPGKITSAVISPDGKVIATQIENKFAFLYDRKSKDELHTIEPCEGSLFAFTPDGKHLLTLRGLPKPKASAREVQLWDVGTGKVARRFELLPRQNAVRQLYGVSDKTLIVVGDDKLITSYDLATGKLIGDFANKGHKPKMLALAPDGKWLLTAGENEELRVWDVQKRKLLHELYDHTTKVEAIAISRDGKWCASATAKHRRLWVFDREKGKEVTRTDHLLFQANYLSFTPDGKALLATGHGAHHGLNVWDWQKTKELRGGAPRRGILELQGDQKAQKKWYVGRLGGASMASDGTLLTIGPQENELRLWFARPDHNDPEPSKKSKR